MIKLIITSTFLGLVEEFTVDPRELWQAVLGEMELDVTKANFKTWFRYTHIVENAGGTVVVGVPNVMTRDWLEKKFHDDILKTLIKLQPLTRAVTYKVGVKPDKATTEPARFGDPDPSPRPVPRSAAPRAEARQISFATSAKTAANNLNQRYTFDNFVVGGSNDFAHAAAQAIAKNPGTKYNPFFIYGGVGLGKTHLMQAIGNEIYRHDNTKRIEYVTIEGFTNEFIDAIQKKKNSAFTDKYRNVDVLIIDDMQFLAGKEKTQDEFFHTFNTLHQANKQIIISSDKPPKQLVMLEDRLISRFEMGITVDIQPPDLETRSAIIQTKAQGQGMTLSLDIIEYLARHAQDNVRELEGALTKVAMAYERQNGQLELVAVQRLLAGEAPARAKFKPLAPRAIIEKVAEYFDVSVADILGPKRDKEIVMPRQITMYLMRHELSLSFPKIAKNVGGRDHTTAMHSVSKIERALEDDNDLRSDVQSLRERLVT